MWIISEKYGAFNTDNLSAIRILDPVSDVPTIQAFSDERGFYITEGRENYQKILEAIANNTSIVEVF